MKQFPNIIQFIEQTQNEYSKIQPIYRRNFRELIKIIPLVGSIIDSNIFGAMEDKILEERLNSLEASCAKVLKTDDLDIIENEITNINNIFFLLLVKNQNSIIDQNIEIKKAVDQIAVGGVGDKDRFIPSKKFLLVTISGASAVGKDCILDLILNRANHANKAFDTLTKFTTRTRRTVDSKYYDFVQLEDFNLLVKGGTIIFPYWKRNAAYGFDKQKLIDASKKDGILITVFTNFETLPSDRMFLKSLGINHTAILLTADKETLLIRSDGRVLNKADIDRRKKSIHKDLKYLQENDKMIQSNFDLIIDNSDYHSKYSTYNEIVRKIGLSDLSIAESDIHNGISNSILHQIDLEK
jgi:guanylate kinase